ncbi:MAG: hypothetical protein ABR912_06360 [Terracidiphilus sp.]|jgi:hypothetical protein
MNLLMEAMNGLGAAVLPVVAALLLEELTYGGLVRLLVAPWPGTEKHGERNDPGGLRKLGNLDNFNNLNNLKREKGEGK